MTESELQEYVEFANELPGGQRSAILRLVAEVERLNDQLTRLRRNSERWEWLAEFGFYKCSGGSLSLRLNASNREELVDAVDDAIAAEKGTE